MTPREHRYHTTVRWTGNTGAGTAGYRAYQRAHAIEVDGKPPIAGSSDPAFRGDPACWNPEELFVASLASCHMLWYLHLCAEGGVVVTAYADAAEGTMREAGAGAFVGVRLRPQVRLAPGSDAKRALALHEEAHRHCFIANSVSVPIIVEPEVRIGDTPPV